MKVLVTARLGEAELKRRLAAQVGDQVIWVADGDAMIPELASADVLICPDNFYSTKLAEAVRRDAPKLALIQLLTAGFDHAKRQGVPAHVTLCNAGEAYASAVATHAITLLLALQRHIPTTLANQGRHAWDRAFTPQLTMPAASTIVVVGLGPIGREIARILRAFGARVIGVTRRGLPDPSADEVVAAGALRDVLPRADAIVIAAPLDESTRNLIDARALAACRKTAVLVNVARGGIVEPRALETALRSFAIAGAGLDVTDPEPLPPNDPLWDAPNLIVSPHCAGASGAASGERLADLVCANLARFMRGEKLQHVVTL
jgi:phosphoglycerate dehydrogenase-like enzyme